MPKYSNLVPAVNWFFTHANPADNQKLVCHRLALFATNADGEVVGLIPVDGIDQKSPKFVAVPPNVGGRYVYAESESELHN